MNRITLLRTLLFLCSATIFGPISYAQPPIQFSNTPEAIKKYEAGMLDTLRERCASTKAGSLWDRSEIRAISNGYAYLQDQLPEKGRYSVFAYDQDTHSFILIDGQALDRNTRLTLKLALPRDYARCRIVRNPGGAEQLEVATIEKTYPSDSLSFQRLIKEAAELSEQVSGEGVADARAAGADHGATPCANAPERGSAAPKDKLFLKGKAVAFPECHAAALALRERMGRLMRRVFER